MISNDKERRKAKWHFWGLYFASLLVFGGAVFSVSWTQRNIDEKNTDTNLALNTQINELHRLVERLDTISDVTNIIDSLAIERNKIVEQAGPFSHEILSYNKEIDANRKMMSRYLEANEKINSSVSVKSQIDLISNRINFLSEKLFQTRENILTQIQELNELNEKVETLESENTTHVERIGQLENSLVLVARGAGGSSSGKNVYLDKYVDINSKLINLTTQIGSEAELLLKKIAELEGELYKANGNPKIRLSKDETSDVQKGINFIKIGVSDIDSLINL